MKWAEICCELIQAIGGTFCLPKGCVGAFTTGFYILNVGCHNSWSVKTQAPVRSEWAVKLSVLLPVSNYRGHLYAPFAVGKGLLATINSCEPHNSLSGPRAGLHLLGEQRLSSGLQMRASEVSDMVKGAEAPTPASVSDLALRP